MVSHHQTGWPARGLRQSLAQPSVEGAYGGWRNSDWEDRKFFV